MTISYKHYEFDKIIKQYRSSGRRINPGSVLEYNMILTHTSVCSPFVNHLDTSLHAVATDRTPIQLTTPQPYQSYSDIMDQRATDIIQAAKLSGRQLLISWSGGIDSHGILIALLKNGAKPTVALTSHSVYECPRFYRNHIQGKLEIIHPTEAVHLPEYPWMHVKTTTAGNMFGGDKIADFLYSNYDEMREPATRDRILRLWSHTLQDDEYYLSKIDQHVDVFIEQVRDNARKLDADVSRFYQFIVFSDITFRMNREIWLQDAMGFFSRNSPPDVIASAQNFNSTWSRKFFNYQPFYDWNIHHASIEDRFGSSRFDHKKAMKDYIFEFDKDEDYRYKLKTQSVGNQLPTFNGLTYQSNTYLAIDENYNIVTTACSNDLMDQVNAANDRKI